MNMLEVFYTLVGIPLSQIPSLLNELLPADAYKAISSAKYLTDISPAWMRKKLTEFFGLVGFGWGYSYDASTITITKVEVVRKRGQRDEYTEFVYFVEILFFTFWYKVQDKDGNVTRHEIQATGGAENKVAAYALKGALTAALGNAVSNLGWQEDVYLGKRSHLTVRKKKKAKRPAKSASSAKPTPAKKPATAKAKPAPKAELTLDDFYKIPIGNKAGQPLAAQDMKAINFYAKMKADTPEKAELKKRAQAFLKREDREALHNVALALYNLFLKEKEEAAKVEEPVAV